MKQKAFINMQWVFLALTLPLFFPYRCDVISYCIDAATSSQYVTHISWGEDD